MSSCTRSRSVKHICSETTPCSLLRSWQLAALQCRRTKIFQHPCVRLWPQRSRTELLTQLLIKDSLSTWRLTETYQRAAKTRHSTLTLEMGHVEWQQDFIHVSALSRLFDNPDNRCTNLLLPQFPHQPTPSISNPPHLPPPHHNVHPKPPPLIFPIYASRKPRLYSPVPPSPSSDSGKRLPNPPTRLLLADIRGSPPLCRPI